MSLLDRIAIFFGFKEQTWRDPNSVKCPDRYRKMLQDAYWEVAAKLEKIGIDRRHRLKKMSVVTGTVLRPLGWAVPFAGSPTGYAGGYASDTAMTMVSNPTNGEIVYRDVCHEWAEAILQFTPKYKAMTVDQRHAVIGSAHI